MQYDHNQVRKKNRSVPICMLSNIIGFINIMLKVSVYPK